MKIVPVAANDQERLQALNEYSILDAIPESDFEDITRIAAAVCHTPSSLVSIADIHGTWFKSGHGLEINCIPGDFAAVAREADAGHTVCVIPDLTLTDRFRHYPFVAGEPHITFFASVPLVTPEKFVLGALCIFDYKPHKLFESQAETLKALARQVVTQLDLRKKIFRQNQKQEELKRAYADLEKFSYIVSHDLKSPLNNIISLTHLLKDDYGKKLDDEGNEYINFLNVAAYQLSDLVSGILNYSKSSQMVVEHKDHILVPELIGEVVRQLNLPAETIVNYKKEPAHMYSSRAALKQVLLHLVHNAAKYNDKLPVIINIHFSEDKYDYIFEIEDNGPGIAGEDQDKIFELFERLHKKKDGESMGIGLAIVKRLIEKLGGAISVTSTPPNGATFRFTVAK